jgi:plasmid stabilization system protein ParE
MSEYEVILSRRAENMIIAHTEFLARVSPNAARKLLMDFRKVIKVLKVTPFRYPFADEQDVQGIPYETYRKCLFDGRYKALYLVDEVIVYIDAIIDCRQENRNLFGHT